MLPAATSRSTPSSAVIVPKRLIRPCASIIVLVKPSSVASTCAEPLIVPQAHAGARSFAQLCLDHTQRLANLTQVIGGMHHNRQCAAELILVLPGFKALD